MCCRAASVTRDPLIIRTSSSIAVVARQWLHARDGSSIGNQFFDAILMIGECGDLRQMRDAEDLVS